ncbi:transcription antiterminator [Marinilactibacillus psychrotolerans]|uniref:BglG family transcription antiterminator n=1 Tax=Marinilactibacillus psychrotolerans TaxID=191770 RepID=UPI0038851143
MDQLALEIIANTLVRNEVTIHSIARSLGITENKAILSIDSINSEEERPIIKYQKEKIYFSQEQVEKYYHISKKEGFLQYSISLRRMLLILLLALKERSYSLQDLAEQMKVSKNTIVSDLNTLKSDLEEKECRLFYSRKDGYSLEGEELIVRKLLVETVNKIFNIPVGKYLLFEEGLLDANEVIFLQKRLQKVEERLNILLSDEMVEVLPYTAYSIVQRKKNTNSSCSLTTEIKAVTNSREYETIISAFWNYDFLDEDDLIYLAVLVLSSNMINSEFTVYNTDALDQTITCFIATIESKLAIQFSNVEQLKKVLLQHIRPALFRAELGISIVNPLTKQFKEEYRSIYRLVKQEMTMFDAFVPKPFSEDETAFIAMIVLSNIMEYSKQKEDKPFKAVVVCKSGTSISKMLLGLLEELFPFISFKGTYSARQFESSVIEADFIFSTVPLNTDQEVLLVSSYMNYRDRVELKERVDRKIEENTVRKARYILSYLGDYLKQEKEKEAIDTLSKFLAEDQIEEEKEQEKSEDLIIDDCQISIIDEKWEWEDCIEKAFNPISNRGNINQQYIEACKKAFAVSYKTMLIGPQVLLPHVGFEEGVQKMDAQISILKHPIVDPDGEKYQVIVALAPGQHNEHVNWLMRLNEKFVSEHLKEKLLSAADSVEAMNFIEGKTIDGIR